MRHRPATDPLAAETVLPAATLSYLQEETGDDRILRRTLSLAVAAHVVLLAVHLPSGNDAALAEPPRPFVYVVQTPVFVDPAPPDTKIPERRKVKVPVPDPTPDDPEPIREIEADEPLQLDRDLLALWTVPETPPAAPVARPVPYHTGMERPRRIYDPPPVYTELARRTGTQGVAIVEAIIDVDGNVTSVRIVKDLPMGLGEAAAQAVKQWRFEPATLHGKPTAVYYSLSVHFGIQ
jgi:TonB family protein